MRATAALRAAVASDPGLTRAVNEDRVWADESRGIFLVIDGLGGHAAGETAAETALRVIQEQLIERHTDSFAAADLEPHVRAAITEANNCIYRLSVEEEQYRGMACVLTLAVAQEDRVTVAHVGDSRLYLAWNGNLRKITCDHSPVGELEDQGEITENEAMRHPRRNEVFRDVGSQPHSPDDPQFIEIKNLVFRPDAALLLCSDGLTDLLTSAQIAGILDCYDGDPDTVARRLVEAANAAGGKDNISVVFAAGPEFLGNESGPLQDSRPRHAITRMRHVRSRWRRPLRDIVWLAIGLVLGILLCIGLQLLFPKFLR